MIEQFPIQKPLFITFEGVDGAGKSIQIKMLSNYLKSFGISDILVTREPGGTSISEKIRAILLDKENTAISDMTEAMLYAASRAQHVSELIKPHLNSGGTVICDRFLDSSIAYQSAARGISVETIEKINSFAVCGLEPDITFLLDIEPMVGLQRKKKDSEPDRLESEQTVFFKKVRAGYLELSKRHKNRIIVIDADDTPDKIHNQIIVHFTVFW